VAPLRRNVLVCACMALLLVAVPAAAAPGELDPTFGTGGKLTGTFGGEATAVALAPDGRIVVAGWADQKFAVARYSPNGSLDATFDGDGKLTTAVGTEDQAWALVHQPDGKIVTAGYSSNGTNYDFALVRYNANGALDTTFDADGIVRTAIGTGDDEAYGLALQPDGKIVAAGRSRHASGAYYLAAARYNPDGSLDTTFGGSPGPGWVTVGIGPGDAAAFGVKLQPDGKIVAAGSASNGTNYDVAVVRLLSDGSLDASWTTPIGASDEEAYALTLQADGKIVAAGYSSNGTNNDFALVRYNVNGSLDSTFDSDGKVTTDVATRDDEAWTLAVQPDGKLVATGHALTWTGSAHDYALARYAPDGSLDGGFGTGGKVVTPIGTGASSDYVRGAALQPDGRIVVAGSAVVTQTSWGVARYVLDGTAPTNPTLTSTSHTPGVWSADPTVDVAFAGAADDWGSVDGFSFLWDTSPALAPDTVKDAEETAAGTTSSSLADGAHYLHLRAVDAAGNWSAPVHQGPFRIDTTAPGPAGVSPLAAFQTDPSFPVGWSAEDAGSGVAGYEVRYTRATLNGPFGPAVAWQSDETANGTPFAPLPGSTYCLSARATDVLGNRGGFGSETCTAAPAGASILARKGSWARKSHRGAYLGSYFVSRRRGDSLSVRVSAKRLVLVATKCPRCGTADVRFGGRLLRRINLRAAKTRRSVLIDVATFTSVRTGKVRIRVVSAKRPVRVEGLGVSRA
jgi:uncharacterized delta-60 repeat protein